MTDPRIPDDGERLDGLGLETLSNDVRPTSRQWSAIATTAAHRRQRRTWLLAVAAMVVLVVGTAAVVLGRSGTESVNVSAGGLGAEARLLPPEDATDVTAARMEGGDPAGGTGSVILYTDTDGRPWVVRQGMPRQMVLDAEAQLVSTATTANRRPDEPPGVSVRHGLAHLRRLDVRW